MSAQGSTKSVAILGGSGSPNDKGYFVDLTALQAAYPTGNNGWFAITGTPDAIWIWDSGTSAWVNSGTSGSPGGADTQIQVNNAGVFAGYSKLRYIDVDSTVYLGNEGGYGGVQGADATTLDVNGSGAGFFGGIGNNYGDGGDLTIGGGAGGNRGDGGIVHIDGGTAGNNEGDGGGLEFKGGRSYFGEGGYLDMRGGQGAIRGGGAYFQGGSSSGGLFGYGGEMYFTGGSGEIAGNVTFEAGYSSVTVTNGIATFVINGIGSGYAIDDTFTVNTGSTLANFIVTSVDVGGVVNGINQLSLGSGYSVSSNVATTNIVGTGTGLTIDILTLVSGGDGKILFRQSSFGFTSELDVSSLTSNRVHTLPNATGTLALTSDIPAGVLKLPTYTVGASGADYTTIQGAIDVATIGGTIYVTDGTYSPFVFKYANTRVIGNGYSTKIEADCAVTPTIVGFNTSNLAGCSLENFYIANTNATTQGIGFDFSNTPLCNFKNLHFYNLGTAIRANDTADFTFYNRFEDVKIFECNNGIDLNTTNPINDNSFENFRIALKAGGGGKGLYMNNAQGNTFYSFNAEPGTATGITGIHLDTNLVINTVFEGIYLENNATGVNINSAQRTTFIGGMIVANTVNVTDTGLDTAYLNTNVNYALYNQLANVVARDLSNASRKALDVYNNTSFAHNSGSLARIAMQNATDTSKVLLIENAGSGDSLSIMDGSTEEFKVDSTGIAYSQTGILPTIGKSAMLSSGIFL